MADVARVDFGRLDGSRIEETPQGGLRVPATLTRVGVFEYRRADGTVVRELRPPEEVFDAASLSTARSAPVTDLHPPEGMVSPRTWQTRSVGHVGEDVRQDGEYIAASVVIQDGAEVARVRRRDRAEISMGYRCELDETPGEWRGQRYDAVQRNIRYNHAALGPRGWGRAGREVGLRLDGGDAVLVRSDADDHPPVSPAQQAPSAVMRADSMSTIRIDGVDVTLPTGTDRQVIERAIGDRDQRLDSITRELETTRASRDELQGRLDALTQERDQLQGRLDELDRPERLEQLVQERADLLETARRIAPDARFDGLSTRQVMITALGLDRDESLRDRLDSLSDDYVRGRFESASTTPMPRQHSPSSVRAAAGAAQVGQPRTDARERSLQTLHDAWRQPGDMTKRAPSN